MTADKGTGAPGWWATKRAPTELLAGFVLGVLMLGSCSDKFTACKETHTCPIPAASGGEGGSESTGGASEPTSPADGGVAANAGGAVMSDGGMTAIAGAGAGAGAGGTCTAPSLDCDGSGECATDSSVDANHCGNCETECFQQCRSGVCADPMQVSVGLTHACALLSDGSVWCWGSNFWGELGSGHPDGTTSPVRVALPQAATAVQAGGAAQEVGDPIAVSCAVLQDETVRCWGAGKLGGLGNGVTKDSAEPMELKGVTNVSQLSLGLGHGCAVTGGGKLYCWGFNKDGQVGNGLTSNVATPATVLTSVSQVSCGGAHTCARKSNGDLFCWGNASSGQLGIPNLPASTKTPLSVPGMNDTDEVSLGANHTLARKGTTTYGWGHDYSGQVNATFSYVTTPVQVDIDDQPPAAKRVIAGTNVSSVIGTDDTITTWGSAFRGDGQSSTGFTPAEIDVGRVRDVSFGWGPADEQTVCVIKADHELICWGSDTYGQVGDGDPLAEVRTPTAIIFEE